jgi:HlyD family secretion protein
VPDTDGLVIEAKIAPRDIDHVRIGQDALVRFSAFDQRTTPEFEGTLQHISADLVKEKDSLPGAGPGYTARIVLSGKDMRTSTGLRLLPGMPAEVHVVSGERTALSYLLKPLRDQFSRAFTEK